MSRVYFHSQSEGDVAVRGAEPPSPSRGFDVKTAIREIEKGLHAARTYAEEEAVIRAALLAAWEAGRREGREAP